MAEDLDIDVDIEVDTKAQAKIVFVNFKAVPLSSTGKGTARVKANADNVLQWGIVGDPETAYTITLKPRQGQLKIGGQHPIKLQIPKDFQQAAGNRRFRVVI